MARLSRASASLRPHSVPHQTVGDIRNPQVFAQERTRERRQIGIQRRRFDHAAAERIGQHHAAGAHRFDQARNAQRGIAAQFERIAEIGIDAAEDDGDTFQPRQRLQEHLPVAHRQVVAFHQREAEIMGEIDMFEIGFVIGPRRQQHGAALDAVGQRLHAIAIGPEERGQALDAHRAKEIGKGLGDHDAVFERVAQPARRVGARGQHGHDPSRRPRQVGGIEMHMHVVRRPDSISGRRNCGWPKTRCGGRWPSAISRCGP